MTLTAYFDASGTHRQDGSLAMCVAGYVSTPRRWKKFEREWEELLREEGISAFHRTDLESLRKEFKGWTVERRDRVVKRAHKIIKRWALMGVAVGFPFDLYERIIHTPELRKRFSKPYALCTMRCIIPLSEWATEQGYRDPINYVFDRGDEGRGQVLNAFRLSDHDRYLLGTCQFEDKKKFVPLQAADVLAYEVYKFTTEQVVKGGAERGMREGLEDLLGIPHIIHGFTEESFEWLVAGGARGEASLG